MTRAAIESVRLSCSCGGELAPVCLEDRARAGDESAWTALSGRMLRSSVACSAGKASASMRQARQAVRDPQAAAWATNRASLVGAPAAERFATAMPF